MAIPEPIPLAFFACKIACRVEMDMAPRRLQKGRSNQCKKEIYEKDLAATL